MAGSFSAYFSRVNVTRILFLSLLIIFTACSKDDDEISESGGGFYDGAQTSASKEQLSGLWSIYEVAFEGKSAEVPGNFEECGRDFFQFSSNGTYREYIYTSNYECEKEVLALNWELEKGVVTLSNDWGQSDEMVITQLNSDKMVFKMQMDIDEEPEMEVLSFVARRYAPPNDIDLYSHTFGAALINSSEDKIKLTWQAFEGFYKFDRYEIYRSNTGCSKANATLIGTITNRSQNFFIDEDPPVAEEICYYFKLYNEKGLVAESELTNFFTNYLRPAKVEFVNVEVQNNAVNLKWQTYRGNYFSHYVITVRNYKSGSGYAYQEYPVATIEDPQVTEFVDETPPRLKDPVYAIYAYDIFGNVSSEPYSDNSWELNWDHPEVLGLDMIQFVTPDANTPEIYLYGRQPNNEYKLLKYNYRNNSITATANKPPNVSTSINMQVHTGNNGKELFFAQGNTLAIYDANDLTSKYKLASGDLPSFSDFAYLENNIFSFTDSRFIYTFKRNNSNLEFIAKKAHFTTHHGSGNYHFIPLKDNEILVGHFQEARSYKFTISTSGEISEGEVVDIPVKSRWEKKTFYNPGKDYVVNLLENRIYSTLSYSFKDSFESPYFPTGISRDGNLILGSNNDPQEFVSDDSTHEKKVRIYDLTTGKLTSIETKGYPHFLFENHLGEIMSISSGFKREDLESSTPKPDIFVEKVEF